jgi:hypothetical protein
MIAILLFIGSVSASTPTPAPTPTPRPISQEAMEAHKALICWWPEKGTPERVAIIQARKQAVGCNQ